MAEYRSVEGAFGAVDTLTNLTTFGGETSVGPIKVPANASRLVEIWSANSIDIDTAGDNGNVMLRLSGKGMAQGDQDFVLGTLHHASEGTSVGGTAASPVQILPVELEVVPNETINVAAMVTGDTVLLGTQGITLVFA